MILQAPASPHRINHTHKNGSLKNKKIKVVTFTRSEFRERLVSEQQPGNQSTTSKLSVYTSFGRESVKEIPVPPFALIHREEHFTSHDVRCSLVIGARFDYITWVIEY